jgi:hypothetical protein
MPIVPILEAIENTASSMAIREGALLYPIIGGFHLLGIALFGGMVVATDFRLLGWAMQTRPVSELIEPLRWWKRAGFVLITVSGLLLAWGEPLKLYRSPAFWVKMALFALLGVHALAFRRSTSKWRAAISLLLWAGLIVSGRLIAFDE